MAGHVFHELYAHLNWHTKGNQPLMTPDVETLVHEYLERRCKAASGVVFHGVGGTPNHVHLVVEFEPTVCLSDLVAGLRSASTDEVHVENGLKAVEWQRGFGAVSFGRKNLPWVLDYVAHQKEHHAAGTVHERLENVGEEE